MNQSGKWMIGLGVVGAAAWWLLAGGEPPPVSTAEPDAAAGPGAALTGPRGAPELSVELLGDRRASISGRVVDDKGGAIAGAYVCAFARSSRLASADRATPTCASSGKDGHYTLAGLFGGRQSVSASAAGFIPRRYAHGEGAMRREWVELRPGQAARDIDIRLLGGGVEIKGHVRDLSGGAVPGALVTVDAAVTFADPEGAFALWVKPGDVYVGAKAEGYTHGHEEGLAPGHLFDVFLTPEAVIVGKVVRAGDGTPVEGARVEASGGEGWDTGQEAFTDAAGQFRLDGLKPGAYKPKSTGEDSYGVAKEQVVLGMGETSEVLLIEAHPAFTIEGRIVSDDGEACSEGGVSITDKANDRGTWKDTEMDGQVRFEGVLPGEHSLDISCVGFVSAEKYDPVKVVDASVKGLKWQVSRGLAIRGSVTDDAGKPVPDLDVYAQPRADPGKPRAHQTSSWSGKCDEEGTFELVGLLPGDYEVSISSWSAQRAVPDRPESVTLTKGKDAEVRIRLPATAELRGRVRDSSGKPVRKASVGLSGGAQYHSVNAADDGTFVMLHAPPGEYRAVARQGWDTVRSAGTRDDDPQGVKVTLAAGSRETIELVVEDMSGRISGVVRAEGGPVVDAFVEATRESDSAAAASGGAARESRWGSYFKTPEMTDQDGKFTLTGLGPGKYTLRAHRNGGGEALREHVAVGETAELTIEVPGSLAGTVKVRGGSAPEQININVRDEATGYRRGDTFFRTNGVWRIPEVPQGNYKITASSGDGSQEVTIALAAGEQREDVRIELAPKVTVRGTVVDLENKPVAGLRVVIGNGGGFSFGGWSSDEKQNITDEAGRFEVPRAPVGKVEVYVMPRNWGAGDEYGWTSVPLNLSDGQAVVELPPIRVTKKRVKEEEVAGELGYRLKEEEPGADPLQRKLVVAVLVPGGPAGAAGLQVGDEITQIDGNDVTGPNAYLHGNLTRVLAGTTVTLGLARGASVQITAGKKP